MTGASGCARNPTEWELNSVNSLGFVTTGSTIVSMAKLIVRGVDARVVNRNKMCYPSCDLYDLRY